MAVTKSLQELPQSRLTRFLHVRFGSHGRIENMLGRVCISSMVAFGTLLEICRLKVSYLGADNMGRASPVSRAGRVCRDEFQSGIP